MICPNCKTNNSDDDVFCVTCGTRLVKEEANAKSSAGGKNGITAMGDKNVVAGDVVNNVSTVDNSSVVNTTVNNSTTIINNDDTKKIVTCNCCGKHVTFDKVYTCPECGKYACESCYDFTYKVCAKCSGQKKAKAMAEAKSAEEKAMLEEKQRQEKAAEELKAKNAKAMAEAQLKKEKEAAEQAAFNARYAEIEKAAVEKTMKILLAKNPDLGQGY